MKGKCRDKNRATPKQNKNADPFRVSAQMFREQQAWPWDQWYRELNIRKRKGGER